MHKHPIPPGYRGEHIETPITPPKVTSVIYSSLCDALKDLADFIYECRYNTSVNSDNITVLLGVLYHYNWRFKIYGIAGFLSSYAWSKNNKSLKLNIGLNWYELTIGKLELEVYPNQIKYYYGHNTEKMLKIYDYEEVDSIEYLNFLDFLKQIISKQDGNESTEISGSTESRETTKQITGIQIESNPIAVAEGSFRNAAAITGGGGQAKLLRIWGELEYPRVRGTALQG